MISTGISGNCESIIFTLRSVRKITERLRAGTVECYLAIELRKKNPPRFVGSRNQYRANHP